MKKFLSVLMIFALAASLLASCGKKLTEEEAKEIVGPLIEKSYEINEIYFGNGIPHEEPPEDTEDNTVYDIKPVNYLAAKSDKYHAIYELKEAALEVYTESYLESVFEITFEGIQDPDGNVYQYAKYITTVTDDFAVREDIEKDNILSGRTYDVSTLKIVDQSRDYVYFTVQSYIDGEDAGVIQLSIKDEGAGWRLDSPTY